KHFKSALVAFVSEFRLEHVEAQLALLRAVTFARYELETRLGVDEAADQPSAGNAIRVDTFARHPSPAAQRLGEVGLRLCFACHWFVLVQLSFEASEQLFRCFAPDGAEEIDGNDLGETLA